MSTHHWSIKFDGKYDVYVDRTFQTGMGVLKIELNGEVLHSKPVVIAPNGPFGPDEFDVAEWEEECLAFHESLKNKS